MKAWLRADPSLSRTDRARIVGAMRNQDREGQPARVAAAPKAPKEPRVLPRAEETRDRGSGSGVLGRDYDACMTLTEHRDQEDVLVLVTRARVQMWSVAWSVARTRAAGVLHLPAAILRLQRTYGVGRFRSSIRSGVVLAWHVWLKWRKASCRQNRK